MKRYLGISSDEERLLVELGPHLEKHFPELSERFYSQIPFHPNAAKVFSGGAAQIERLKQTLQKWAYGLFSGEYDERYAEDRFRIGYRHVSIGLEQRYVISAMGIVRSFLMDCLLTEIADLQQRRNYGIALSRILDLDLNLMCESYMYATLENLRRLNADLEAVNRKLEEAGRTKDIFLSHVSHELRTPLNSILGFTKLILDGLCSSPEEERELLRDVFSSARHLLDLVNDLLDIRQIEAGKLNLHMQSINLQNLVASTLPLIAMQASEKNLDIRDEMAGAKLPAVVWADEVRVRQVLLNLLYNAVKFTSAGSITIRANPTPDSNQQRTMIRIEVEDTGMGIPPEMRSKVFGEFVQGGAASTTKLRGAGLGLAISRRLVELMGGMIGVQSGANERGTLAWFMLPQAPFRSALQQEPTKQL